MKTRILKAWLLCLVPGALLAQAPVIQSISPNAGTVGIYQKLELTIDLTASFTNPYDYDDIVVRASFTAPSGKVDQIEGFYYSSYTLNTNTGNLTPTGQNSFRIRYAPAETGTYSYTVTATNIQGSTTSNVSQFTATGSTDKGFVRKGLSNYLQHDNGDQYIMIGQNLAWQQNNKYLNFKNWTDKLAANKANFIRLWQCYWGLGIEWTGSIYGGLKQYNQINSFYTDQLLDECAAKDIYMMLCINHHGMVSTSVNPEWSTSPYNSANGGPCNNTWDYFTNNTAKALHKNRLRYIVARWGYSKNIMSWELFNEVEWTDQYNSYKTQVKDWHAEMAAYLKSKDPFKHLVTTSFAHDYNDAATWNLPDIDFTQTHYYNGSPNFETVLTGGVQQYLISYSKPTYTGEFGINASQSSLASLDPTGIHIHNAVWATLFSGGMGAGSSWWWDSYIEPQNLYTHYRGAANVAAAIPLAAQRYSPTTGTVAGAGGGDAVISPGSGWGRSPANSFSIDASGTMTPAANNLGEYIYGSQCKSAEKNSPTFNVTSPAGSQLRIRVTDVSSFCNAQRLSVRVNGNELLNTAVAANTTYTVNLPAGNNAILVDNAGGDWFRVSSYTFTGMGSALHTYLLKSADNKRAAGWIHNKKYNWTDAGPSGSIPPAVNGASISLANMANGTYDIKWYECTNGTVASTTVVSATNGTLQFTIPSLAWDLAFTATEQSVLPLRLLSFKGLAQAQQHLLYIDIADDSHVASVQVERSANATLFEKIGVLTAGPNGFKGKHQFADKAPLPAQSFYRLKTTDRDGSVSYSQVISLLRAGQLSIQLFPNPVQHTLQLALAAPQGQYQLRILNQQGQPVKQVPCQLMPIATPWQVGVKELVAGSFYCQLLNADGKIIASKTFIKE
ncbi:MAG: DUF5060 domain-containing protein [Chitinophagaceae bacterium]|nr:DUF5060 domain-containing protein [Chitinophagaceae bacterium]